MKIYTIIGGINGVGKSSFTGVLRTQANDLGIIVDADKLAVEAGGNLLAGGRKAIQIIEECIAKGTSFTQETTLSGHRVKKTAKRVWEKGYDIHLYYIGLDTAEESKIRIANRVAHGGHSVPDRDVDRRFLTRWDSLMEILPYCGEASFFDNNNGFVQVASYRNGELTVEGDCRPGWVEEFAELYRKRKLNK